MATKSLQRSIAQLKSEGYTVAIVERWNPFAHVRQDLFGFIDLLAIKEGETGVFGVQACSDNGDLSTHLKKITVHDPSDKNSGTRLSNVKSWIGSKNRLEVWSWGKRGDRGKRKLWTVTRTPVTLESFN